MQFTPVALSCLLLVIQDRVTSQTVQTVVHRGKQFYYNSCSTCGLSTRPLFTHGSSSSWQGQIDYFGKRRKRSDSNYSDLAILEPDTGVPDGSFAFGEDGGNVVVGGRPGQSGELPWLVLVTDMNDALQCGGTILNRLYVLTAAHCTEDFRKVAAGEVHSFPSNILVVLDHPNVCQKETWPVENLRRVRKVQDHPRYQRMDGQLLYDFAVLELDSPILEFKQSRRPVCLPMRSMWRETFDDSTATVGGYGRVKSASTGGDDSSCNVQVAELNVVPAGSPKCQLVSSFPDSQMCTFQEGSDACEGDSGGPLTVPLGASGDYDRHTIVGVVSYGGEVCAHKELAGVYARVTRVMPWIITVIQTGECQYD